MSKPRAALHAAGWVTVGVVIAGGVATAATTTGGSSSTSTTPITATPAASAPSNPANPSTNAKKGRGGRLGRLQKRLLHGEVTVLGKGGTPEVYDEQRGTVTQVTPNSVTLVTSKDNNFTQTYVLDSNTRVRVDGKKSDIGSLKTGQPGAVIAKVNGTTKTAVLVIERAAR